MGPVTLTPEAAEAVRVLKEKITSVLHCGHEFSIVKANFQSVLT